MIKNIKMIEDMREKTMVLMAAKSLADTRLQAFLEGCMSGLGLNGDWNLDTRTLTFLKMPKPKKEGK